MAARLREPANTQGAPDRDALMVKLYQRSLLSETEIPKKPLSPMGP